MIRVYKAISDFIQYYRNLFLNPAGNTAEILLLTAMLVVGFVVMWMGSGMIYGWLRAGLRRFQLIERPNRVVGLITVGVLVLFASLIALNYKITSSTSFCGRACHSMNPEFQVWRRSKHR